MNWMYWKFACVMYITLFVLITNSQFILQVSCPYLSCLLRLLCSKKDQVYEDVADTWGCFSAYLEVSWKYLNLYLHFLCIKIYCISILTFVRHQILGNEEILWKQIMCQCTVTSFTIYFNFLCFSLRFV